MSVQNSPGIGSDTNSLITQNTCQTFFKDHKVTILAGVAVAAGIAMALTGGLAALPIAFSVALVAGGIFLATGGLGVGIHNECCPSTDLYEGFSSDSRSIEMIDFASEEDFFVGGNSVSKAPPRSEIHEDSTAASDDFLWTAVVSASEERKDTSQSIWPLFSSEIMTPGRETAKLVKDHKLPVLQPEHKEPQFVAPKAAEGPSCTTVSLYTPPFSPKSPVNAKLSVNPLIDSTPQLLASSLRPVSLPQFPHQNFTVALYTPPTPSPVPAESIEDTFIGAVTPPHSEIHEDSPAVIAPRTPSYEEAFPELPKHKKDKVSALSTTPLVVESPKPSYEEEFPRLPTLAPVVVESQKPSFAEMATRPRREVKRTFAEMAARSPKEQVPPALSQAPSALNKPQPKQTLPAQEKVSSPVPPLSVVVEQEKVEELKSSPLSLEEVVEEQSPGKNKRKKLEHALALEQNPLLDIDETAFTKEKFVEKIGKNKRKKLERAAALKANPMLSVDVPGVNAPSQEEQRSTAGKVARWFSSWLY